MIISLGHNSLAHVVEYGAENNTILDRLCAMIIAISPILQHYIGPVENAGFTVLLLNMPIILCRLLLRIKTKRFRKSCIKPIIPLVIYEVYYTFIRGNSINRIFYGSFMIVIFFAIAAGCVNLSYVFKYALIISILASFILIFIQYPSYYIFHHLFRPVPINLLIPGQSGKWDHIRSYGSVSLYRPAAFFLEPSHMFLYIFPIICILLFSKEKQPWTMKVAVLLSASILLTTSGMGLVTIFGLWMLYFAIYKNNNYSRKQIISKLLSVKVLGVILISTTIIIVLYYAVDIFRSSVNRFLLNENGYNVAIDGRTRLANNYIARMSIREKIFGATDSISSMEFNLAGYSATLIKTGYIGVILTYLYYGQGLFKLSGGYFWLSFLIIAISLFSAHTHGSFYMIFYFCILCNGYFLNSKQTGRDT